MALDYIDSFNLYATANVVQRWTVITNTPDIFGGGRFGGNRMRLGNGESVSMRGLLADAVRATGFNYFVDGAAGTTQVNFLDGASSQVRIDISESANTITALRGGTVNIGSVSVNILLNTWYYIEVEVTISTTVGTVKVWVDNTLVMNLSGVNTQATANPTSNGTTFANSLINFLYLDELYLSNGAGGVNVGRLGPRRVLDASLNGDGALADWTPSTGVNHFALVDEKPPNTSDWNETDVVNDIDTYTIAALTGAVIASVNGVQVSYFAQETGLTPRQIQGVVRIGGVNFNSSSLDLLSGYFYRYYVLDENPDIAAPWTQATVESTEYGQELTV